jgi:hypothetical protein
VQELKQWLLSKGDLGASNLDLLLDYAYSDRTMLPIEPAQLSRVEEPCLLVFSILLDIDLGNLIHEFHRMGFTDKGLPFDIHRLEVAWARIPVIKFPSESARAFFERQWVYCPLIFSLDMGRDLPTQMALPILRRQRINAKGSTSTIYEIVVLEEFVDSALRQVVVNSRFDDPQDGLGYVSEAFQNIHRLHCQESLNTC